MGDGSIVDPSNGAVRRRTQAVASAAGRGKEEGRAGTRVGRKEKGKAGSRDAGRFENGTIGRSAKVGGIRRDCLREQGDPWRQTAAACLDLARSPASASLSLSLSPLSLSLSLSHQPSRRGSPRLASPIRIDRTCIRCMHMYAPTCLTWSAILLIYFGARFSVSFSFSFSFSLSLALALFSLCCSLWTSVVMLPSADDRSKCVGLVSRESRA